MSVVYGKHRRVEAGHGLHLAPAAPRGRARSPRAARAARPPRRTSAASLDGPEHHLGLGRRRDDVRRDAAGDQADGVVRAGRAPDRPAARSSAARSARRSACRSPTRRARETTNARRGPLARSLSRRMPRVARPRRLSVGSPSTETAQPVRPRRSRRLRAVAAALLADDEHQADARLAVAPQPLGRRDLRGENALRVARAAAVQPVALDAARERTAARSRSASRSTTAGGRPADRRDDVEARRRRPAAR